MLSSFFPAVYMKSCSLTAQHFRDLRKMSLLPIVYMTTLEIHI